MVFLVKFAQEKSVVRWTDCPDMTIAVDWDAKHQTNQHLMLFLSSADFLSEFSKKSFRNTIRV